MEQYDQISECDYQLAVTDSVYGIGENRHAHNCEKCSWKTKANKIEMQVHECPLSSNQYVEKSTAYEPNVSGSFSNWRDVTVSPMNYVGLAWRPQYLKVFKSKNGSH